MIARALVIALVCGLACAQPAEMQPPERRDVPTGVQSLLDAPYLSESEKADARVEFGRWTPEDLADPVRRAKAALIVGAYSDGVFANDAVDALDRAEAALRLGESARALELLAGRGESRAVRLRVRALADLGRSAEAAAAAEPLMDRLGRQNVVDAREMSEIVRALMVRTDIVGSQAAGGGDFTALRDLITRAREELDRLSWRARDVEAELLFSRHNRKEARDAAIEALRYNPKAVAPAALMGHLAVGAFDFASAERIAAALEQSVRDFTGDAEAVSLEAQEIRARAALREREGDLAAEAIEAGLAVAPNHVALRALQAAAAAVSFDEARTSDLLARFDRERPGSAEALFEVGSALSEARQYAEAADMLEQAARRLPNDSRAWIELGLLEVQSGRDQNAKAALERAVSLDPFNTRATNSLTLVNELATYATVESEHFIVRYRPGIDEALAREMPGVLERIHERVAGPAGFDHEPDRKTVVELMPSHDWFAVRITGMPQIHTVAASTGPVIAMESPQEGPGFSLGHYDWARTLQHEYAHTVGLSRTRNRIPHWFTEASAVFVEDAPRDYPRWQLLLRAFETETLFDLRKINVAFVRPERPTDRAQAYTQGHWMYEFIVERWGQDAPLRLMDRYAQGEDEASAMRAEFGVDSESFMAEFTPWARAQLEAVGLLAREGAPSVQEMIEADTRELDEEAKKAFEVDQPFVDRWLEQHPDHPDLLELRVRLALRQSAGRATAENAPLLEAYAKARPVDDMPHRLLAAHYLASDDPADHQNAVPHLEFLDAREQSSTAYAVELSRLHAAGERWEGASRFAERATMLAPFDADEREFAARVAIRTGRMEDAERHLTALTIIEPGQEIHRRRLEAFRTRFGGGVSGS